MADFAVSNNILVNFDSHGANSENDVYKDCGIGYVNTSSSILLMNFDNETEEMIDDDLNEEIEKRNRAILELKIESVRAVNATEKQSDLVRVYRNSKSSGISLTTLPSSPSEECCFNNLEIVRFCVSKSFARILSNQIPKCLEEANCSSLKCLSRVISNLCSDKASSKTSPFSIPLGDNLTPCPNFDKKENNPLCTFSSNKNFILGRDKLETSFCQLGSKLQSCFDMLLSEGWVSFNNFFSIGSIFQHLQNYGNHDSCAFESRLTMADVGINHNVIINFNSHNANNDNPIFKGCEKERKEIAVLDCSSNSGLILLTSLKKNDR